MKTKRFLLALIAASMTLAGCGKDDKSSEEPQEPAPSETVDPSGETDPSGGGGSDTDPSGEEDQDKLTPAQRESATSIQNTVKLVLTLTKRYDEATINGIDEYTLAYSEEVALEDVNFNNLYPAMIDVLTLDTSDAEAVVDFVIKLKKNKLLDEASYVAVAAGKSLLRAESVVNEDFSEALVYAADYLDKEGAELHKNVYAFLDSIVGCASVFMSEEFSDAINSVYNKDENQVSYEKVCEVMTSAGSALMQFSSGYESASYLANLLVDGLEEYAQEALELEEETEEFEEEFDIQSVIDSIYSTTAMAGFMLSYLPAYEEFPLEHIVDLINLGLGEKYGELVLALFGDYMSYIGIEESEWQGGMGSLVSSVAGFYSAVQNIITNLSGDFVDSETGKFSAALLQAAVAACGAQIEGLGKFSSSAIAFDEYLVLVVHNTLTVVADYEEEEAEVIASKFDFTEEIADAYASIADAGDFISNIDPVIFEIVADFINGEFEEGIKTLLKYVGYEGDFDAAKAEFEAIKGNVLSIVGYFADEAFTEKLFEVYDAESGTVDLEKAKALIVEVAGTLEGFLDVKENVKNLGDTLLLALKLAFIKGGIDEAEVDELLAEFDVNEFVEMIFGVIQTAISEFKAVGETDDYDIYLNAIKGLVEAFSGEDKTWDSIYSDVVDVLCDFIENNFEIDSGRIDSVNSALNTPVRIKQIIDLIELFAGASEGSFIDNIIEIDSETGVKTIKETAPGLLIAIVNIFAAAFSNLANDWVVTVEVAEEIAYKISEVSESGQSAFNYLKGGFESIRDGLGSVVTFLSDSDNVLALSSAFILYGNLVLEALAIIDAYEEDGYVERYTIAEYICRVVSNFTGTTSVPFELAALDDIQGKVAEAIGLETIKEFMEAGETVDIFGTGVAFDLLEDDGVYSLEITLVSECSAQIIEGALNSISVKGEVYTFELPYPELIGTLLSMAGSAEAPIANA